MKKTKRKDMTLFEAMEIARGARMPYEADHEKALPTAERIRLAAERIAAAAVANVEGQAAEADLVAMVQERQAAGWQATKTKDVKGYPLVAMWGVR